MPFEVVKVKNSKELWEFRFNDFFRLLDLFRTSRNCGGRGGQIVSALVSRSSGPGSSPDPDWEWQFTRTTQVY